MTSTIVQFPTRPATPRRGAGRDEGIRALAKAPRRPGRPSEAQCRFVEQAVAIALRVRLEDLRAPSRKRAHIAFARQVAMYLAHVSFGLTYTEVGRCFERDRTTVAHACRLVEDRRDLPSLDASLDYLEAAIRSWTTGLQANAAPEGDRP